MYTTTIARHSDLSDDLLQTLITLAQQIPEFDGRYTIEDYRARLTNKPMLVQLMSVEGELAGFKIGYSEQPGQFYSWLGGILPEYRQLGLAKTLLADQEAWAKAHGFERIAVNTYNQFTSMLQMLIKQGYKVVGLQTNKEQVDNNKLFLNKLLN